MTIKEIIALLRTHFFIGFMLSPFIAAIFYVPVVWFMDAYGIYDAPRVPGINALKIYGTHQTRLSKAHSVCTQKPKTVIFGSSRIQQGFLMDHPEWEALAPYYNYGMGGMLIDEIREGVKHAYYAGEGNLEHVIVTLDFFAFNALRQQHQYIDVVKNYRNARLLLGDGRDCMDALKSDWDKLLGMRGLQATINTLPDQYTLNNGIPQYYQRNGAYHPTLNALHHQITNHDDEMHMGTLNGYMTHTWRANTDPRFCMKSEEYDALGAFHELLHFAQEKGVEVTLAINPLPLYMQVGLDEIGLLDTYFEWREAVMQVRAEVADSLNKPLATLWDFSGDHPITAGDPLAEPIKEWYFEGSHYTPALGKRMMDCMFGSATDGFCVKLGADRAVNNAAYAQKQRAAIARFKTEFAEATKQTADFAADAEATLGPIICASPSRTNPNFTDEGEAK